MPTDTAQQNRRTGRWRTVVTTVLVVFLVYAVSLIGYYWLSKSSNGLAAPDLTSGADTVVVLRLNQVDTFDNRLKADVLVYPAEELTVPQLGLLNTDLSVLLTSDSERAELVFPRDRAPAGTAVSVLASGDVDDWPFDTYGTETVRATVLARTGPVGNGEAPQRIPARIELTGTINGWKIWQISDGDSFSVTLTRTRSSLAFDLGICLVLLTLPATALFVAIETVSGRKRFLPPMTTWYAALLFSVVPLRNVLPGAPPAGAWIDQILVLWVLVALVVAMVTYIVAWWRQAE